MLSSTITADSCFSECTPPHLGSGDIVLSGIYLKNFNDDQYTKRYANDLENEFGLKIRARFLSFKPPEEMSVNCPSCCRRIECSPLLQTGHPNKVMNHVAELDLTLIRERLAISGSKATIHAVFAPVGKSDSHPGNPCHFNIVSDEVGLEIKTLIRKCLEGTDSLPAAMPTIDAEVARVKNELIEHSSMIKLHLNVVDPSLLK